MEFEHISVLLDEVIEHMDIKEDGTYVDGTLGGAGHSSAIIAMLGRDGRLIGIDQDEEAIAAATEKLSTGGKLDERVTIVRDNFVNMKNALNRLDIDRVDGILLDLGVSSHQFDDAARGFSYHEDVPLDMRMDLSADLTARDVVNNYPEEELKRILKEYGEEKFAGSIARNIVKAREESPIETTGELIDIIRRSMPQKEKNKKGHPARKTFQALRIEVNSELDVLKEVLDDAIDLLKPDGRLCIITFHSLEDRIVKQAFLKAENPCTCPKDFPVCVCGKVSRGSMKPHKPVVPTDEEIERNKRSRSAKLRVFIKSKNGDLDD